ncbi:MAG: hypothetical protein WC501_05270 [Candidatus Micrarchaeia archaeon]
MTNSTSTEDLNKLLVLAEYSDNFQEKKTAGLKLVELLSDPSSLYYLLRSTLVPSEVGDAARNRIRKHKSDAIEKCSNAEDLLNISCGGTIPRFTDDGQMDAGRKVIEVYRKSKEPDKLRRMAARTDLFSELRKEAELAAIDLFVDIYESHPHTVWLNLIEICKCDDLKDLKHESDLEFTADVGEKAGMELIKICVSKSFLSNLTSFAKSDSSDIPEKVKKAAREKLKSLAKQYSHDLAGLLNPIEGDGIELPPKIPRPSTGPKKHSPKKGTIKNS